MSFPSRLRLTFLLCLALAMLAAACGTQLDIEIATDNSTDGANSSGPVVATEPTPDGPDAPTPSTESPTPEAVTPTPVPVVSRPALSLDDAIPFYFDSVEEYWSQRLAEVQGVDFEPVSDRFPYDPSDLDTVPECAGQLGPRELYEGNAFYCSPDDFIAWDNVGLFPDLLQQFGDFAVGLVIAHEYGHAVQERTGERGPTIFIELQADCYAGAWAGAMDRGEIGGSGPMQLSGDDLNGAIGGFLLFRDPLGTPESDPGAHGSAFDRVSAFVDGFRAGPETCTDYLVDRPEVATILIDLSDPNEGNLPLDDLIPLLEDDLEPYLNRLGADVIGASYTAPAVAVAFGGAAGDPPPCGDLSVTAEEVRGIAFFCTETGQVFYDRSEMDDLFTRDNAGDFASAYSFAHAYAQSLVVASDVEAGLQQVLSADCIVGVWARDIWEEQQLVIAAEERLHALSLSAGDLDEGVFGLVLVPGTVPSLAQEVQLLAFDRVASFGSGFFDGLNECGLR